MHPNECGEVAQLHEVCCPNGDSGCKILTEEVSKMVPAANKGRRGGGCYNTNHVKTKTQTPQGGLKFPTPMPANSLLKEGATSLKKKPECSHTRHTP